MTPADLESVIARTGHARLRWLTSDANPDAAQRESYRKLVARMAADAHRQPPTSLADIRRQPPTSAVPLAESRRAVKLGLSRCLYASKPACSCQGAARCHRLGRIVSIRDCLDCLKP